MVAVCVTKATLIRGAPIRRGRPATVDAGLAEVLHTVAMRSRQTQVRLANVARESITVVVA
jgi:hypothetical protein